ncbi:toxin co-regulated pilus biosynthesis Q family protein [Methylotenera sp.]|uniref:toxin co-regulated pilus biosynthesis Q family protein n=1 Tax=Methylotenera sp. TaxID=2051956 RepID=UPI002ED99367
MFISSLKFNRQYILVGCLLSLAGMAGCATSKAEPDPFDIEPIIPNLSKSATPSKSTESAKSLKIEPIAITKEAPKTIKEPDDFQIEPIESTSFEITPIPKSWKLHLGKLVGMELQEWAKAEGWTVVWQVPKDWNVAAETTFQGDFKTASSAVINSLANSGAIIRAQFHDLNKTLVITGPGVAAK